MEHFRALGALVVVVAGGLFLHLYLQGLNREWMDQAQKGKGGLPVVRVPQGVSPTMIQQVQQDWERAAVNPSPIGRR